MKDRKDPRHDPRDVTAPRYIHIADDVCVIRRQTDRTISRSKNGRANSETSVEEQLRSIGVDHHGHIALLYKRIERRKEEKQKKQKKKKKRRRRKRRRWRRRRKRDIRRIDEFDFNQGEKFVCSFVAPLRKERVTVRAHFELTIWSVVGIILLQKGAISLRDKMKSRNDTADVQGKLEKWNEKESIRESTNVTENRRYVTKVYRIGIRRTNVVADKLDDVTSSNDRLSRKLHSSRRTHHTVHEILKKNSTIEKRTSMVTTTEVRREHDTRGTRATQTLIVHANKNNEPKNINYDENYDEKIINNTTPSIPFEFKHTGSVNVATSNERNSVEHRSNDIISYETKIGNGKSETKPRRSPVNRIGAAVAIIMLAIGIIMLLLGPFIVILRALGNRRRTREMVHKKRNRNDRPPTYEEATLMDQAPRYSTLQLDTILESSSL